VKPRKPTPAELRAAYGKRVPDVIAPRLKVLFVGINPGLYSGAVGHHFARPGNRFWAALHRAGFTPRLLSPFEERELLRHGLGITNLVNRATATADQLSDKQLLAGGRRLVARVKRFRPRVVAILGVGAYQAAFGKRRVAIGPQSEIMGGAVLWVLPNPSGLNANYQLADLARLFRRLRAAADRAVQARSSGRSRK
jgi:TDG/mug DNA glycosylase family protein